MIKPTLGRIVWYRPLSTDPVGYKGLTAPRYAAIIAFVHDDETLNLTVFSANGDTFGRQNVKLVQDGEPSPGCCEWMPYQKRNAAVAPSVYPDVFPVMERLLIERANGHAVDSGLLDPSCEGVKSTTPVVDAPAVL